jgi:hypothetical protein
MNLRCNRIQSRGAKYLGDALKMNSGLQGICLPFNRIGDAGAKSIADAFSVNSSLQMIYMGDNEIGDDGAKCIVSALKKNTNSAMQAIGLTGNDIGKENLELLEFELQACKKRANCRQNLAICSFMDAMKTKNKLRFDKNILNFYVMSLWVLVKILKRELRTIMELTLKNLKGLMKSQDA